MGLPLRISRVCASANIAGALLAASYGEATAGGFGVEQSAYFQGMSFAGAAAGGPSLASISWNPATAGFAGNGLTMESSYSVVLMSAGLTVANPQDQRACPSANPPPLQAASRHRPQTCPPSAPIVQIDLIA